MNILGFIVALFVGLNVDVEVPQSAFLQDYCTAKPHSNELTQSLKNNYSGLNAKFEGVESSGLVSGDHWNLEEVNIEGEEERVAMRKMPLKTQDEIATVSKEIEIKKKLEKMDITTQIVGCNQLEDNFYVAEEIAEGISIDNIEFKFALLSLSPLGKTDFFISMFDLVQKMNSEGVVNNNMTPANMIYNPKTNELKIKDFKMAKEISDTKKVPTGKMGYMSPGRLNGEKLTYLDDLYSGVFSYSSSLMPGSSLVFSPKDGEKFNIDTTCFLTKGTRECSNDLMERAGKLFEENGLGKYTGASKIEIMTLSDLLARILEYRSFKYSIEEVGAALVRIRSEMANSNNENDSQFLYEFIDAEVVKGEKTVATKIQEDINNLINDHRNCNKNKAEEPLLKSKNLII